MRSIVAAPLSFIVVVAACAGLVRRDEILKRELGALALGSEEVVRGEVIGGADGRSWLALNEAPVLPVPGPDLERGACVERLPHEPDDSWLVFEAAGVAIELPRTDGEPVTVWVVDRSRRCVAPLIRPWRPPPEPLEPSGDELVGVPAEAGEVVVEAEDVIAAQPGLELIRVGAQGFEILTAAGELLLAEGDPPAQDEEDEEEDDEADAEDDEEEQDRYEASLTVGELGPGIFLVTWATSVFEGGSKGNEGERHITEHTLWIPGDGLYEPLASELTDTGAGGGGTCGEDEERSHSASILAWRGGWLVLAVENEHTAGFSGEDDSGCCGEFETHTERWRWDLVRLDGTRTQLTQRERTSETRGSPCQWEDE